MNPVNKTFIFFLKSDIEKPQFVFTKKRKIYLGKIFHCVDKYSFPHWPNLRSKITQLPGRHTDLAGRWWKGIHRYVRHLLGFSTQRENELWNSEKNCQGHWFLAPTTPLIPPKGSSIIFAEVSSIAFYLPMYWKGVCQSTRVETNPRGFLQSLYYWNEPWYSPL